MMHCLPGGSRIYGKWATDIHDGSTPGGKAMTPKDHLHFIHSIAVIAS